jgi:hypothetical protein
VISFGGANRRLGGFGSPGDYATFKFPPTPRHDPAVFSDAAIQFCMTIKVLFKLPLRQTTGRELSLKVDGAVKSG